MKKRPCLCEACLNARNAEIRRYITHIYKMVDDTDAGIYSTIGGAFLYKEEVLRKIKALLN